MTHDPETQYAVTEDGVHIAYQVFGEGDVDVVLVPGFISHVELQWDWPEVASFLHRLGAACRVVTFDKRGTGLSDRATGVPDLDQRMLDVLAVMDAAGVEEAALIGLSEGGPMAAVFAATHPRRTKALVLYGSYASLVRTDDHPLGFPEEAIDRTASFLEQGWGHGVALGVFAPSRMEDEATRSRWARLQRMAASPGAIHNLVSSYMKIDARSALPLVQAPTLVVHREGDRIAPLALGEEMAASIEGARLVVYPGDDHLWFLDPGPELETVIEFLTGAPSVAPTERFLATVLFTDIVSSTERAGAEGDEAWNRILGEHDRVVKRLIDRHGGRLVKHTGDGALALFDGPTRGVRCGADLSGATRHLGLEVRTGLHVGEIIDRGSDVAGIAVHLAERVCGEAAPGEVLVSRTVVDLVVGSGLAFADRGMHHLKGIDADWQLYALTD